MLKNPPWGLCLGYFIITGSDYQKLTMSVQSKQQVTLSRESKKAYAIYINYAYMKCLV